jgi:hypothetical protein
MLKCVCKMRSKVLWMKHDHYILVNDILSVLNQFNISIVRPHNYLYLILCSLEVLRTACKQLRLDFWFPGLL